MDDELKQRLVKYLDGIEGSAPGAIAEWLRWEFIECITVAVVTSVLLLICLPILIRRCKKEKWDHDGNDFGIAFSCGLISMVAPIFLMLSLFEGARIHYAPNAYIVQKIVNLGKQ